MPISSTLNAKLGKVSDIMFCTSAGKDMCKKIFTGENTRFTIKLGCKQPSKAVNPYQIQYRLRSRYTAANAKTKGADWTAWSAWKALLNVKTGVAAGSTANPDTWLKSNKGVNKKSSYMTFYEFNNVGIAQTYDARQYQIRIRTYNAATRKHGPWVNSSYLSVCRAAIVANETIHRGAGGQLMFDCNYQWDRGGTVHVTSIKDKEDRELLVANLTKAMNFDSQRTVNSTPPTREGYTAGEFELSLSEIKRELNYGEKLYWTAWYQTKDGAKTYLTSPITVSTQDTSIDPPVVKIAKDQLRGYLTVRVYKAEASDVIEGAACNVTYTYKGKDYTLSPNSTSKNLTIATTTDPIATFKFTSPPLGIPLSVKVTVSNDYHSSRTFVGETMLAENLYIMASTTASSEVTAVVDEGNCELTISRDAKLTTGLPYGRNLPFAVYAKGSTSTIRINGKVLEDLVSEDRYTHRMSRKWWEAISSNMGIYTVRTPYGDLYKVAVKSVNISRVNAKVCEFDIECEEVS